MERAAEVAVAPKPIRAPRRRIVVTLALSIALAVVPPLISPNATNLQLGLLVGLASLSAGLLVEQYLRSTEINEELRRSARSGSLAGSDAIRQELTRITPVINAPTECRDLVDQIVVDWRRIERYSDVPFFAKIREKFSDEFLARLATLADGRIAVPVSITHTFRASEFAGVTKYQTMTLGPFEWWSTQTGRDYLRIQAEKLGAERRKAERLNKTTDLTIRRIFVLKESTLDTWKDTLKEHAAAGIDVSIVVEDNVRPEDHGHLRDLAIVNYGERRMLITLSTPRGGHFAGEETLSVVRADIDAAEQSLRAISMYARSLADVYRDQ